MTIKHIVLISLLFTAGDHLVESQNILALPAPRLRGQMSVEQALDSRTTVRQFKEYELALGELSQLLWAARGGSIDGLTGATRTYPSAGGISRYVPLDAGHASQSLLLQAEALNLAAAIVGAFSDSDVEQILDLKGEEALLIVPIGRPAL